MLSGMDEAYGLFCQGDKIGAIKRLREINKLDLKDAKDIVDSWRK